MIRPKCCFRNIRLLVRIEVMRQLDHFSFSFSWSPYVFFFHFWKRYLQRHNSIFLYLRLFDIMLSVIQVNSDILVIPFQITSRLCLLQRPAGVPQDSPCPPHFCTLNWPVVFFWITPAMTMWTGAECWSGSYLTKLRALQHMWLSQEN